MLGTWVNTATVLAGSTIGLAFGDRLPERLKQSVFTGLGLITMSIGISMVIKGSRPLVIVGSLVIGGVIGELIGIERELERFAGWLQRRARVRSGDFVRGFVTASILFCVGPMTVVGSIQDGVSGDSTLLLTKSVMDGFSSIALAATTGVGVLFSAATVIIVQGSLTLLSGLLSALTRPAAIDQLSAVGGLLILGLAIRMLGLKDIRVANYLPALVIVAVAVVWF
ncbi:MAG: DUF554 domain-containing protein [candidate division Zixibacteria bacterium]|nr:DUF554 domain-containing protein [candidate division Zixibacteria bacterium]